MPEEYNENNSVGDGNSEREHLKQFKKMANDCEISLQNPKESLSNFQVIETESPNPKEREVGSNASRNILQVPVKSNMFHKKVTQSLPRKEEVKTNRNFPFQRSEVKVRNNKGKFFLIIE